MTKLKMSQAVAAALADAMRGNPTVVVLEPRRLYSGRAEVVTGEDELLPLLPAGPVIGDATVTT